MPERQTDRQRVEVTLISQILLGVLINGVDRQDETAIRTHLLLKQATDEAVSDLVDGHRNRLLRRSEYAHREIMEPFTRAGSSVAVLGLVAFYFLQELVRQEYLCVGRDSALKRALDLLLPALEPAANVPELDGEAQRRLPEFIEKMHRQGYFRKLHLGEVLARPAL
ncbi:hypothetical protein [Faunimonas pinastri]|uniref:hypothetical protein n=1 Tax=Faunimonas pinastri TaxID=1855383 RepID=UPI000B8A53CE|nr:hypothetical protein [Faunimonas pinastri]